jgi:hypothetical protein
MYVSMHAYIHVRAHTYIMYTITHTHTHTQIWHEVYSNNYYKSLDHRSFYFKQVDKKSTSSKAFWQDIHTAHRQLRYVPSAPPHLAYAFPDETIHHDILRLVTHAVSHSSGSVNGSSNQGNGAVDDTSSSSHAYNSSSGSMNVSESLQQLHASGATHNHREDQAKESARSMERLFKLFLHAFLGLRTRESIYDEMLPSTSSNATAAGDDASRHTNNSLQARHGDHFTQSESGEDACIHDVFGAKFDHSRQKDGGNTQSQDSITSKVPSDDDNESSLPTSITQSSGSEVQAVKIGSSEPGPVLEHVCVSAGTEPCRSATREDDDATEASPLGDAMVAESDGGNAELSRESEDAVVAERDGGNAEVSRESEDAVVAGRGSGVSRESGERDGNHVHEHYDPWQVMCFVLLVLCVYMYTHIPTYMRRA